MVPELAREATVQGRLANRPCAQKKIDSLWILPGE